MSKLSMNTIEEILMKISRLFGVIVLTFTLLVLTVLTLSIVVDSISKAMEKTVPDVKFYMSDFVADKDEELPSNQIRPESLDSVFAKNAVESMKPSYTKALNSYLSENEERLFRNEETREEQKANFIETHLARFTTNSERSISYILRQFYDEEVYSYYVQGLINYLETAENADLNVYSAANGYPYNNITNSKVFSKYNDEFASQMRTIKSKQDKGGWESMLSSFSIYAAIFFLINIFILVSVMFAIVRIEKKMK